MKKHTTFISWIQANVKSIITVTVSLFVGSVFFIGLGGSFFNDQARQQNTRGESDYKDRLREERLSGFPEALKPMLQETLATVQLGGRQEKINLEELYSSLNRVPQYRKFKSLFSEESDSQKKYMKLYLMQIQNQVLESMIDQKLWILSALKENKNLKKSTEEQIKAVVSARGGSYDNFLSRAEQEGLSEKDFHNTFLQQTAINLLKEDFEKKVIGEMTPGEIPVMAKAFYDKNPQLFKLNESLEIDNLVIRPNVFFDQVKIDDQMVDKYFHSNRKDFNTGNRKKIRHILIQPTLEEYKKGVKVTNEEKSDHYNKNIESYTHQDRVQARHILIKTSDGIRFPFTNYTYVVSANTTDSPLLSLVFKPETSLEHKETLKVEDILLKREGSPLPLNRVETEKSQKIPDGGFPIKGENPITLVFDGKKDEKIGSYTLSIKGLDLPVSSLFNLASGDFDGIEIAKILKGKIQNGTPFEDLAKLYSADLSNSSKGGDLGTFPRGKMVPEFEEACFAGAKGELLDPVRTAYGVHLIEVIDRLPQETLPYPKVHEEIETMLREKKAEEQARVQADEAFEKLKKGTDFKTLVAEYSTAPSKAKGGELGILFKGPMKDFYPAGDLETLTGEVTTGFALDTVFERSVFPFSMGAKIKPFRSALGYHLVDIIEDLAPIPHEMNESIKSNIRLLLRSEEAKKMVESKMAECEKKIKEGAKFQDLVAEYSTSQSKEMGGRIKGILAPSGPLEEWKIGFEEPFRDEIIDSSGKISSAYVETFKTLKTGEVSGVIKLNVGQAIFRVAARESERKQDFKEVSEEIELLVAKEIPETRLKKVYEENKEKFETEESVQLAWIKLKDGERAEWILSELKKDATLFGTLAGEWSLEGTSNGGVQDSQSLSSLTPDFKKVAESLKSEGELYPSVLHSGSYYYLIKLHKKVPGALMPFEGKVRENILSQLKNQREQTLAKKYLEMEKSGAKIEVNHRLLNLL